MNNLAGLNAFLDAQLADALNEIWPSADKDAVLTWAVAGLWPHIARELDPTTTTVTLADGTYFYALPAGVLAVSRVEYVDNDDEEHGARDTWEIVGDPLLGTGLIHVPPALADSLGTLRLYSYGRYDVTTNLIPDDYVPLVLAKARAELYRRVAGDRVRFKEWMARQQEQNVSVNELMQFINEADNEAAKLRTQYKTWQRPVPGRIP